MHMLCQSDVRKLKYVPGYYLNEFEALVVCLCRNNIFPRRTVGFFPHWGGENAHLMTYTFGMPIA